MRREARLVLQARRQTPLSRTLGRALAPDPDAARLVAALAAPPLEARRFLVSNGKRCAVCCAPLSTADCLRLLREHFGEEAEVAELLCGTAFPSPGTAVDASPRRLVDEEARWVVWHPQDTDEQAIRVAQKMRSLSQLAAFGRTWLGARLDWSSLGAFKALKAAEAARERLGAPLPPSPREELDAFLAFAALPPLRDGNAGI